MGRFSTNLFRCPSDRDVWTRQQNQIKNPKSVNYYLYSYSLNSHVVNDQNRGMSSLYDPDAVAPPLHFRAARIRNPSQKIMLIDESSRTARGTISTNPDDGRWTPSDNSNPDNGNQITARHGGRGTVSFPDGHVDGVKPIFGNKSANYDPTL